MSSIDVPIQMFGDHGNSIGEAKRALGPFRQHLELMPVGLMHDLEHRLDLLEGELRMEHV